MTRINTKEDNLLSNIELVERQISGLQNYLYEVESYPEQIELWPRIKRSISLFLLKRQIMRQVQYLHLRRRMFRNCYVYVYKEEPRGRPVADEELTESRRP